MMDDLDRLLMEQADEYVKEDRQEEAISITPWESSLSSLVWGFLLISFHVNFFGFPPEFVISTLGFLLLVRGFAAIAHLSGWLRAGFSLALASSVLYEGNLLLSCTPLVLPKAASTALTIFFTLSRITLFYLLYRGLPPFLSAGEQRAEAAEKLKDNLKYLLVTYVLVGLGVFTNGSFLVWVFIILYLVFLYQILKGLGEVRDLLKANAYQVQPRTGPAVTAIRLLILLLALLLILGMPAAMYVSGHPKAEPIREDVSDGSDRVFYGLDLLSIQQETNSGGVPDDWIVDHTERIFADYRAESAGSAAEVFDPARVEEIRTRLIEAGMEETAARSLPPSEIMRYENVTCIYQREEKETAQGADALACTTWSYLCYSAGDDSYRMLQYVSLDPNMKGDYLDAARLYFSPDSAGLISDLTAGVIGEWDGTLTWSKMNCEILDTFSETLLLSFPVPRQSSRYDLYFAFDCIPYTYEAEETHVTWLSTGLAFNLYHREKLWCFPYLSPKEVFGGSGQSMTDLLLNGGGSSSLYQKRTYRSYRFHVPLE